MATAKNSVNAAPAKKVAAKAPATKLVTKATPPVQATKKTSAKAVAPAKKAIASKVATTVVPAAKKAVKKAAAPVPASKDASTKVVASPSQEAQGKVVTSRVKKVVSKSDAPVVKKAAASDTKPIKTVFTKVSLASYLSGQSGVEPKAVKAVIAALESAMVASLSKKGLGSFTLPGLFKIDALKVPAKKKRFGKDPFTGEDRWFDPKPATVRVKGRALKKLKDAALV